MKTVRKKLSVLSNVHQVKPEYISQMAEGSFYESIKNDKLKKILRQRGEPGEGAGRCES